MLSLLDAPMAARSVADATRNGRKDIGWLRSLVTWFKTSFHLLTQASHQQAASRHPQQATGRQPLTRPLPPARQATGRQPPTPPHPPPPPLPAGPQEEAAAAGAGFHEGPLQPPTQRLHACIASRSGEQEELAALAVALLRALGRPVRTVW